MANSKVVSSSGVKQGSKSGGSRGGVVRRITAGLRSLTPAAIGAKGGELATWYRTEHREAHARPSGDRGLTGQGEKGAGFDQTQQILRHFVR
jgi:hypothetical protein